ncbi:phage tail protein [Pedobacter polaris]|uniref:Phage tail protein n=1 Tax=Pedobacter polaris TaxID=2571273 RepID=A0A4U1CUQ4_9SPHI|nr:tail fiber protein [Pedobacter polaris]TKC09869.1 phage tail protein [Pedobacter polaris]
METTIGEIRMFAGNFAPAGWVICDGSILDVYQYDMLALVLGSTYGGDGMETFGVPDLRGRVPLHVGTAPAIAPVKLGELGGKETVTLTADNLPTHTHGLKVLQMQGTDADPAGKMMAISDAASPGYVSMYKPLPKPDPLPDPPPADEFPTPVAMQAGSISFSPGKNGPLPIMQPFTTINFIIATTGIMPSFN